MLLDFGAAILPFNSRVPMLISKRGWMNICSFNLTFVLVLIASLPSSGEERSYQVATPDLRVQTLDSAETESFLAVKLDTEGRIFVGSRAALFVYEPLANGQFAPRSQLLALPDHSWIYDIEIRGNDLYLLTVSALYVLPEARIKRQNLKLKKLVWGVPLGHVHQCFHGMAWGPEGDLYFATGDPLWYYGDFNRPDHWGHWTMFSQPAESDIHQPVTENWVKSPYNGVGAVFRCRPNGSQFQVVARGLRNSCGLAFDHDWNLFTNDNDHESMPAEYVPGRLNHVTPHTYFSWPRGWMLSKTPDRKDLLETMITTLGRAVPVGQSYYDDVFLPEKYRNSLLVARWCTRKVTFYPLKPQGATFRCEEQELLVGQDQARPVGVTVGRGGRIFATICYMAQNEGSPVYKSDLVVITRPDDPAELPFEPYDITQATSSRLQQELGNASLSRRQAAHTEILRRINVDPGQKFEIPESILSTDHARNHWPWIAVALGRAERAFEFTQHRESSVRLQAIRAISETPGALADKMPSSVTTWLSDGNPQIQLAAVGACFDPSIRSQVNFASLKGAATSEDTYLRQTATMLLAETGSFDTIGNLCQNGEAKVRLAGVLAAGFRLTIPKTHAEISADLPLAPWRSEDAYLITFPGEIVDLRKVNPRIGLYTISDHWKAGKHTAEQEQLFDLLEVRLGDESEEVRSQAAYFLSLLNDPRTEPLIARIRSDITQRRLSLATLTPVTKAWTMGPFQDYGIGFKSEHPPEKSLPDPAQTFQSGNLQLEWQPATITRQINFRQTYGPCDDQSFYALFRLESGSRQTAILSVGSDDGIKVWHNGKSIWTNDLTRGALPLQDSFPVELQAGGNDILVRVRNMTGECGLYLHYRALNPVVASIPEKITAGSLGSRLKEAAMGNSVKVDAKFFDMNWPAEVKKGQIERGQQLFSAAGLGCAKCHAKTADAAINAGPSLADAAKRFTVSHLVESILIPGKQISPVFKATQVVTKEGRVLLGLVIGETAERLEMIQTDATQVTIPISEIEERKLQEQSPMPAGLVKTPEELRDILAYLLAS